VVAGCVSGLGSEADHQDEGCVEQNCSLCGGQEGAGTGIFF
jgi:hypothetical protein